MGILKGREEFIPVTCAVLKDADRDAFFGQIRKNRAGSPEELARWLDVPVGLVQDWISGKTNIPYHALQNIAYQFSIELPPVSELRRESVSSALLPKVKPPEPPPPSAPRREREAPREPRPQEPRKAGRQPGRREPRERPVERKTPQHRPAEHKPAQHKQAEHKKPESRWPKLSDALAYWVGVLYAGARIDGERLTFSADRRIGQNFAAGWARRTKELFGVSPDLAIVDDGKVQQAECQIPGFGEFMARTCPGAGSSAAETSLPRWIWSNPAWKAACLRGIGDVSVRFTRHPAIAFGIPSNIGRSLQKLLGSMGFKTQNDPDGAFMISGKEGLDRYFGNVGTENLKLRDQWAAFCRNEAAPDEAAEGGEVALPSHETKPAVENVAPAAEGEAQVAEGAPPVAPVAPAPKKRSHRPKRTLYRGRPGQ